MVFGALIILSKPSDTNARPLENIRLTSLYPVTMSMPCQFLKSCSFLYSLAAIVANKLLSTPPVTKALLSQIVSHPPLLISASNLRLIELGTPWLSHRFLSIES